MPATGSGSSAPAARPLHRCPRLPAPGGSWDVPTFRGDLVTRMRIVDLWTSPKTDSPLVLLEDEARARWLAFYLPTNEADRLARSLRRTPCSHVPVFDLLERVAHAARL